MGAHHQPASPFRGGAVVIATLANPREKFWGAILQLLAIGLSLRGVDLSSFDDFTAQIRDGEPFAAGVMFFPMHRVERLELDLPEGTLPSLAQRFAQRTGQDPAPILVGEFLPNTEDGVERTLPSASSGQALSASPPVDEENAQPYGASQHSRGQEYPHPRAANTAAPGTPSPRHTTSQDTSEDPPSGNRPGGQSR